MQAFAPTDVDESVTARTVKSIVSPRPIAWVSTASEEGIENLAPFSAYNYASHAPPVLLFSTSRREGDWKDTTANVLATEAFAVNVVTADRLEAMDRTSAALDPGESEFDFADVDRAACVKIDAPRVADAAATMECRLFETVDVHGRLVIFGEVVYIHTDDVLYTDGEIDARKVDSVGRLGGPYYTVSEPMAYERQF